MPVPLAAKAGVIAVSVAVAAAIAIYESPEIQRMADDLRRRIAIALHAFGDSITPQERDTLVNRPEDAEGFLESRGLGRGSVPGVEADPETLRRQREELMYWNAIRESKREDEDEKRHRARASTAASSTFDDFLRRDETAEKGAFVYNSGHEAPGHEGLVRRRGGGTEGLRGLNYSVVTDPFADEHGIESDIEFENSLMDPAKDELSDIYSATDVGTAYPPSRTLSPQQQPQPQTQQETASTPIFAPVAQSYGNIAGVLAAGAQSEPRTKAIATAAAPIADRELDADEYMTAGQEIEKEEDTPAHADVYSSIQAWAQGASRDASFYSPLPVSPAPPSESEGEFITDGELTPTDSASLAGSGVDVADEAAASDRFDVRSESSGVHTPTSWSVAGSSEWSGAVYRAPAA